MSSKENTHFLVFLSQNLPLNTINSLSSFKIIKSILKFKKKKKRKRKKSILLLSFKYLNSTKF